MRHILTRSLAAILAGVALAALAIGGVDASTRPRQTEYYGAPGWVEEGAALDLWFALGRYYQAGTGCNSLATCVADTRASIATCADGNGVYKQAISTVPCVRPGTGLTDYEAHTNTIRNSTMVGSASSLPTDWTQSAGNGITFTYGALTTVNGLIVLPVTIAGTATATTTLTIAFEGALQVAALTGQSWTLAAFLSSSGTLPPTTLNISERNSSGSLVHDNTSSTLSLTGTQARQSFSPTLSGGATTAFVFPRLMFNITNTNVYSGTIFIAQPDLTQTPFAMSPCPTSGAAVACAADFITLLNKLPFASTLTMLVSSTPQAPTSYGTTQTPLQIDEGDNNSRIDIDRGSGTALLGAGITVNPTSYTAPGTLNPWSTGTCVVSALAVAPNDMAMVSNGTLGTSSSNAVFTPSRVVIGANGNGVHQLDGTIARVTVWPTQRKPNGFLAGVAGKC